MKTEIISCLLLKSHILLLHCNCVWCKFTLTSQIPANTKHTSIKSVCELDNWRMCVWALSKKVYLYLLSLLETSSDHILQSHTFSGGKIHKGVLRHLWWGWPSYHYCMGVWLGWYRHNCVNLNEITVHLCKLPSVLIILLHKDEGWNVLEPITGMDIPFSSLTGPSSVVMVPSTGGFGGVMLQKIKVKKKERKNSQNNLLWTADMLRCDEHIPVAIEGQLDGIFHNTTTITCWERWGGIWEFHAGKSLTTTSPHFISAQVQHNGY